MDKKKVIDTHVHFWKPDEFYDPDSLDQSFHFPSPDMVLHREFNINDYKKDVSKLKNIDIVGLVYVQVYHNETETEQVIELSKTEKLIRGIVGWTDLKNKNVEANLERLKNMSNGKLVGIRHLTQYEDFNWVWQEDVQRGIKCMENMGLVYDLSFDPQCLKHAPKLASKFPKMTFVIDHMAKPEGKNFVRNEWFDDLEKASKYPNIFCKLSGFIPARANDWSFEMFEPYIKHSLDCFGPERCCYGADWPVFNLGKDCSILDAFGIINRIVLEHFDGDQEKWDKIFHNNAIKIYKISN